MMETENTRLFKHIFLWSGFITVTLCGLALYLVSNSHVGWAMFVTFFTFISTIIMIITEGTYAHIKW